jgi:DNA-binding cell septation regulator SpoVG
VTLRLPSAVAAMPWDEWRRVRRVPTNLRARARDIVMGPGGETLRTPRTLRVHQNLNPEKEDIVSEAEQSVAGAPQISEVRFRFSPGENGLIGYASCRVGDLLLNDLSIIRASDGNLIVVHPRRFSRSGSAHYVHAPVNREMADTLHAAIIGRLQQLLAGTSAQASPEP